jgi:DNA ligase-1
MGATRSRKKKVAVLAELMGPLEAARLDTVVAWLSGDLIQGRIGVGFATAYGVSKATMPAEESAWRVDEVNAAFADIAGISGAGSKLRREQAVGALLVRATAEEQRFLVGLLTGELRQGAQAGIMAEGLAAALDLPATK